MAVDILKISKNLEVLNDDHKRTTTIRLIKPSFAVPSSVSQYIPPRGQHPRAPASKGDVKKDSIVLADVESEKRTC
jgi:hypothetical protein